VRAWRGPFRTAAIVAFTASGLAGCGAPAPSTSLFPLGAGHRWTYDVRTEASGSIAVDHEKLVLRTLGRESLADGPAWRRRSESGADYWLREDETGIYRVASKSDLDAEPRPDERRRYVLRLPATVGAQWDAPTTAYLLRRRADFPPEIRHTHPAVPMRYAIEAVDETVETPAGRFERCVRVRGDATIRLYADPVVGWRDLPLTTLEWYCPGVGLVRLTRNEPVQSPFLSGGTLTMELTSWQ
jgi:hypothetical protein